MENYFDLFQYPVENVLDQLLADRSTGQNIIFATDAYADLGYGETDKITKDAIQRLFNDNRFQTRIFKSKDSQQERTKKNAEVFTPSWVCNLMLEYLDRDWFGRENVFNKQDGETWEPTSETVSFADLGAERSWKSYVKSRRLEITCGEAPFIVSRYDAVNGDIIPIKNRIGILDRKLRVVNENCIIKDEWQKWVETAFQNVYGYEYQGDNLLIARLNILMTYCEYYKEKWNEEPEQEELEKIADYIVWNIWQMDGFGDRIPLLQNVVKVYSPGERSVSVETIRIPIACYVSQWESPQVAMKYKLWKERDDMKFDYVIGNPPYQDNTAGDNDSFAAPIYNIFMDEAYKVSQKTLLIHPARFLFNAGATPKDWNEQMLSDKHFKIVWYEQNSSIIFAGTDIRGGVCISFKDLTQDFGPIEVFTIHVELRNIRTKVWKVASRSLVDIIYNQNKFDLNKLYQVNSKYQKLIGSDGKDKRFRNNIFEKIDLFTESRQSDSDLSIIGLVNNKRTYRYISRSVVDLEHENLTKYKVLVPSANGSGAIGETLSTPLIGTPLIGTPLIGYTQSFIGIGAFETQTEAEFAMKYIKSKFARAMLGILKITQHNPPEKWAYVPLQDFTENSDIDWSRSIPEIDQQLYAKYGLSQTEIDFIESKVREMK